MTIQEVCEGSDKELDSPMGAPLNKYVLYATRVNGSPEGVKERKLPQQLKSPGTLTD